MYIMNENLKYKPGAYSKDFVEQRIEQPLRKRLTCEQYCDILKSRFKRSHLTSSYFVISVMYKNEHFGIVTFCYIVLQTEYLKYIAHLKFHLISFLFFTIIQDVKNIYVILLINGHVDVVSIQFVITINNLPSCKIFKHIRVGIISQGRCS